MNSVMHHICQMNLIIFYYGLILINDLYFYEYLIRFIDLILEITFITKLILCSVVLFFVFILLDCFIDLYLSF